MRTPRVNAPCIFVAAICIQSVIFMIGCAASFGTNFRKTPNDSLILGKTTSSDVKTYLGAPNKIGTMQKNEFRIDSYLYIYTETSASVSAIEEGVIPQRIENFNFLNGKLVGYEFSSSFKEDNTNFDSTAIKQIKKGTSTQSEVVKFLGEPGGKAIYPISDIDEETFIYIYSQAKGHVSTRQYYKKYLKVTFDKQNIVTKIDYTESGEK